MPKTTVATAGYDDAGNMTVYDLAPGETLPPGVHPTPPPGTHPHERERASNAAVPTAEDIRWAENALSEPHPLDIPEAFKRKRGRPPKVRDNGEL